MATLRRFRPGARRASLLAFTAACGIAVIPASASAVAGHAVARAAASGKLAPASASPGASASPAGSAARRPGRPLLLITGDLLAAPSAGGGQQIAVRSAAHGDDIVSIRAAGRVEEIPATAIPFLGRGLSPALFQISALQQAGAHGRLPVRVTFSGRRPSIPGVTLTRSLAGGASGYLTRSSARLFGAALRQQYLADHGTGRYGQDGLFGHGVRISLAGSAPLPVSPPVPSFPMRTVTVHGSNLQGRPDTGDTVFIASADRASRFFPLFGNVNVFVHGSTRFSVPAGHYWAVATFFTGQAVRLVVLPQFTVSGTHAVVHVSEKSASSQITAATPRPSVNTGSSFEVLRGEAHGGPFGFEFSADGTPIWVNPTTRKPTVGTLAAFTELTKLSPAGAKPGYAYNLDFPGPPGRIGSQHFIAPTASLAAVTENYYDDVTTKQAGWVAFGGTPQQLNGGELLEIVPLAMPAVQTQYFTAGPRLVWSNQTFFVLSSVFDSASDVLRSYPLGATQSQDWNRYPLHPAQSTRPRGTAEVVGVSAAREGNTLLLGPVPFSDNQPGHIGEGFYNGSAKTTGSYAVDENGRQIAHGDPRQGIADIHLSARPSSVRFVLSASRTARPFRLSPASRTVWTWRSVRDTAARVPDTWLCSITAQFTLDRRCAVQPLMTLNYQIQGESLSGLTAPGPQVIALAVGHLQLAAAAAVRSVTAQVSFDSGKTWQQATVAAQGGGQYQLGYSAPAGSTVTLRVRATDAASGSITETITRAYGVAQSAPAAAASRAAAVPQATTVARIAAAPRAAAASAGLRRACPAVPAGRARCFALYRPQYGVNRALAEGHKTHPQGWGPKALERAYRLPVSRDPGQTVAVSIAFRTPALAHYLKVYREHYGLPPCTEASGCLRIVNQRGQLTPRAPSGLGSGWDLEATLDVSMISAACPHCRILVVEANSDFDGDLGRTDVTAARLGADVISNSYGLRENGQTQSLRRDYQHPGHMVVASSGDSGFDAANFPANLGSVTAVGGTELKRAPGPRGVTERVWNVRDELGAGTSSCSAYVAKPAWQHDPHCPGRTIADVSAVADNVPIFNKFYGGWVTVGGTSVAAPFISGVFGLAGNATSVTPRYLYQHEADFFDITRGNNVVVGSAAAACGGDYLCQAGKGYDAPTGLGTPDGIGGF